MWEAEESGAEREGGRAVSVSGVREREDDESGAGLRVGAPRSRV